MNNAGRRASHACALLHLLSILIGLTRGVQRPQTSVCDMLLECATFALHKICLPPPYRLVFIRIAIWAACETGFDWGSESAPSQRLPRLTAATLDDVAPIARSADGVDHRSGARPQPITLDIQTARSADCSLGRAKGSLKTAFLPVATRRASARANNIQFPSDNVIASRRARLVLVRPASRGGHQPSHPRVRRSNSRWESKTYLTHLLGRNHRPWRNWSSPDPGDRTHAPGAADVTGRAVRRRSLS